MGTSLLLNFRTNQEVVMKQKKSIVVVVLTIFFSSILLSATVSAQSFTGYKDFRFGMKSSEVISILESICEGKTWGSREKYQEGDNYIEGKRCYSIFRKYRDIQFFFYTDTGKLYQIKVDM